MIIIDEPGKGWPNLFIASAESEIRKRIAPERTSQ